MRVNTVRLDLHIQRLSHVLRHAAVGIQLIAQHVMGRKRDGAVLKDRLRVLVLVVDVEAVR